jgi:hypothetical protein
MILGIYMGYSVDTGRNVYLQPSLASQGVKGTVTNALASAFVGSLGGGKSFCNNRIDGKVGHIAFPVLMFQSQIPLAFLNHTPCRTDKVVVFYQRFFL